MQTEASKKEKSNFCVNCGSATERPKFCSRLCSDAFHQREKRRAQSTQVYENSCLRCGVEIARPRRKFCSAPCKNMYNHKTLYRHKYTVAYVTKSPENFIKSLLNQRGRRKTLTNEYVISLWQKQNGLCAISGEPMTYIRLRKKKVPTNISIDRINSELGYIEGNIQLVCHRVNIMKFDGSAEDLLEWAQKIVKNNAGIPE